MVTKKEHTEFIRLVANGSEQDKAYMVTVGNNKVTGATARVKGSNLAKKYAIEIDTERKRLQDIVTSTKDSEVLKTALNGILSVAEVDAILCNVIKQPESEVGLVKAIDLYYKRFGANSAIKTETKAQISTNLTAEQIKYLNDAIEGKY